MRRSLLLLIALLAVPGVLASFPQGFTHGYTLSSVSSVNGTLNLTAVNSPSFTTGKFGDGVDFGSSNTDKYLWTGAGNTWFTPAEFQNAWSFSLWFKHATGTATNQVAFQGVTGSSGQSWNTIANTNNIVFSYYDGASHVINSGVPLSTDWTHVVVTHDGSLTTKMYVNGKYVGTISDNIGTTTRTTAKGTIGAEYYTSAASFFSGMVDSVYIYKYRLSDDSCNTINQTCGGEVYALYNASGEWDYEPPPAASTHTIHARDLYDDGDLAGVNVTLTSAGNVSNLTDASGNAVFYNLTGTQTWTAWKTGYEGASGTVEENATSNATLWQGIVNVTSITRLIDDAVLSPSLGTWSVNTTGGKTYSGGGTTYPLNIYLADGTNHLTLQYSGAADYYDKDFTVNITAVESTTTTVTGLYDHLLTVSAVLDFTNATVTNYTVNASNTTHGYVASYSTTNGTLTIPLIQDTTVYLVIDAAGYAYANTTLTPDNTSASYEFRLYTENSILVNIFDAETGFSITSENITVTISGTAYEVSNTTATGTLYFDAIPDGLYTVKLVGENYALRQYEVTVADRSTQTLNAFLSLNTQVVTFTVADYDTYTPIEGCSVGMYQLVNSSWTLVEAKSTDITGRAQITYVPYTRYRFNVACDDYEPREFYLDPVIFDSYTIRMRSSPGLDQEPVFYGVNVHFDPTTYQNNQNYTFTIRFLSPEGRLSSYNYTIEYPNGTHTATGTNSIGELFTHDFSIVGASYPSRVTITYTYTTTTGDPVTWSYSYVVGGATVPGGFLDQEDWGLGVFEMALIATGVIIMVGGMAMLYNPTAGALVGLILYGYFTYMGFFPVWSVIITFVAGFFLLARRSA